MHLIMALRSFLSIYFVFTGQNLNFRTRCCGYIILSDRGSVLNVTLCLSTDYPVCLGNFHPIWGLTTTCTYHYSTPNKARSVWYILLIYLTKLVTNVKKKNIVVVYGLESACEEWLKLATEAVWVLFRTKQCQYGGQMILIRNII